MLKAVFFDLDGTLLPMDEDNFVKMYFHLMGQKMVVYGYEPTELIKIIWDGTKLMYKNDGTFTNEEVFWNYFKDAYGVEALKDKVEFDKFYVDQFKHTIKQCCPNPLAETIVNYVKQNNLLCVLSTNPIFPKAGTLTRMSFVGLNETDFDFITSYENSNFCKPNPKYFKMLLDKFNLKPEEVILIGNNELEDAWCAMQVGIKTYLVKDCLITNDKLEEKVEIISMDEVIPTIEKEILKRK